MELKISSDDTSKKYDRLLHYCNIETLERILSDKTLRCSSLDYINLNDKFEAQRKGIEKYAKDFLVACFCNNQQEIVPFWYNYGGDNLKEKVLLKFKNFSVDLKNYIYTDYLITSENMKMYFSCDDFGKTVNHNGILGEILNLHPINIDFDTRNYIGSLQVKDIKYLSIRDPVFIQEYLIREEVSSDNGQNYFSIPIADIRTLGHYKTEHWSYESETRLICRMGIFGNQLFDYVLLRAKDELFRKLEIVENPWADGKFKYKIQSLLNFSPIDEEIKSTISIEKSELHGLLR